MNVTSEVVAWIFLALIGVATCAYMLNGSFHERSIATNTEERTVTWGDTAVWAAGLSVMLVALALGVWAIILPARGTTPSGAVQIWTVTHARDIMQGSLLYIVFGVDVMLLVLVALKKRLQYLFRRAAREEDTALDAAHIQHDAAELQLEAAEKQAETADKAGSP